MPSNTGLSMDLGANPFMQYGLVVTKRDVRLAVLGSLSGLRYTPFTTSLLGNPAFDLGDCIQFTGGNAGTSVKCCVMSFTYTFNRVFNVSGFGKNPATMGAESKADKSATQNSKNSSSNEIQFIKYTNADSFQIRQGFKDAVGDVPAHPVKQLLATFSINTVKETDVEIDFKMSTWDMLPTLSKDTNIFLNFVASFWGVIYELDGEQIGRRLNFSMPPILESFLMEDLTFMRIFTNEAETNKNGGQLTFEDHHIIMNVPANSQKTLNVYGYFVDSYSIYDKTAQIPRINRGFYNFDTGSVEIVVKGQGLAREEKWNGLIILSDEVGLQVIAGYGIEELDEFVSANLLTNLLNQFADSINQEDYSTIVFDNLAESLSVYMTAITFNLVTEDEEYNIVTEDESYNLVTET